MRFYKVECASDNETEYLENIDCKLISSKQGSVMYTGLADLIIPANSIIMNYMLIYRSLNKVMMNITFDYCNSYRNLPPYLRIIIDLSLKYSKEFIHECPYKPIKRLGLENLPLDVFVSVLGLVNFQRGDYKSILDLRDKKGKLICYFNFYWSISQKRTSKVG